MTWKSLLRCLVQVTVWLVGVVTLSCIKSTLRIPCMELQPSNAATVAGVLREDAVFLARNCSSRVEPQVLNCTVVEVETLCFFDTQKIHIYIYIYYTYMCVHIIFVFFVLGLLSEV